MTTRKALARLNRTEQAIRAEARLYGAKVEFSDGGKHRKYKLTFPSGSTRTGTFAYAPKIPDMAIRLCRQDVRRFADSCGAKQVDSV